MRGRNRFHVFRGLKRKSRWDRPDAYDATQAKGWERYFGWGFGAACVGLAAGAAIAFWPNEPIPQKYYTELNVNFGSCHVGGGENCVVDGDTLWIDGVKVRVADIDAPETHDYKCASEKALGDRATVRLRQLVNSGTVTLGRIDRDEDRYGRKLRIVMVDGESVGDTLVGEGLARWYGSGRKPWC